jgi:hypothetical protein
MFDLLDEALDTQPTGDLLDTLAGYKAQVQDAIRESVVRARSEGMTWEQIGHSLGVTKQAAQQRYGS